MLADVANKDDLCAKQALVSKLALCSSQAELHCFTEKTLAVTDVEGLTEGWMSEFEVFALEKIPYTDATQEIRDKMLAALESRDDPSKPKGTIKLQKGLLPLTTKS